MEGAKGACLPSSTEPASSVLIPELPREIALDILVRLPHLVQARLRLVCRAWQDAMEPAAMSSLRKMRHISEVWPVKDLQLYNSSGPLFTVVDPLLRRTHNISHPPQLRSHASSLTFVVLNIVGYEVLIAVLPKPAVPVRLALELQGLYSFDGVRMKWKDFKYSSLPHSLELALPMNMFGTHFPDFVADMDNSYLYVMGENFGFHDVERLDLKTKMWETLPQPHVKRTNAVGVMLEGFFYMIGGLNVDSYNYVCIRSGEIWDPASRKWTLVPELWPYEVFGRDITSSRVAVVMDRLYALRGVPAFSTGFSEELMYYETSRKLWISLGYIPFNGPRLFSSGISEGLMYYETSRRHHLFGMDQELWVLEDGSMTFLASKPSLSQPLSWRTLANSSEAPLYDKWIGAMLV